MRTHPLPIFFDKARRAGLDSLLIAAGCFGLVHCGSNSSDSEKDPKENPGTGSGGEFSDGPDGTGGRAAGGGGTSPCDPAVEDCSYLGVVDAVFFAQTHLQQTGHEYEALAGNRETLIKANVVAEGSQPAPDVWASLSLNGETLDIPLSGPAILPNPVVKTPGPEAHSFDDSFTGFIPREWMKTGLSVSVHASVNVEEIGELNVGAPTKLVLNMFDVEYFEEAPGDYPAGWLEQLVAVYPLSEIELRARPRIVFEELVIRPRPDLGVEVTRVDSKQDYTDQTGLPFDGEQGAALEWVAALSAAAGTASRAALNYINIYGAKAGGQAGEFRGVGSGIAPEVLVHEIGHALSLSHWDRPKWAEIYPYLDAMFGISYPPAAGRFFRDRYPHVGPSWGFDRVTGQLRAPTVISALRDRDTLEESELLTFRADPMVEDIYAGRPDPDERETYLFRRFSDYSARKMKEYMESHVVVWSSDLNSWAQWDQATGSYSTPVANDGVQYPVERDVEVISVMAATCASKSSVNMVYPPIGPYTSDMIKLFDPRVPEERADAAAVFCDMGCDVSLRITQGGGEKIYMLNSRWDSSVGPTEEESLRTRAVNLPASDGAVSRVELLLTPNAQINGLPSSPRVLSSWTN